jgi:CBS domain-containing protein
MTTLARHVMTSEVITVTPATPLSEFARICAEDEISGAPVVTVEGRLVGIVSKTDLISRVLEGGHAFAANRDFRSLFGLGEQDVGAMPGMASESEEEVIGTVQDVMQTEVVTVSPDAPVHEVAWKLATERIHRVVVTEGDRLLGIITSLDLLRVFPEERPAVPEPARAPAGAPKRRSAKAKRAGKPRRKPKPKARPARRRAGKRK